MINIEQLRSPKEERRRSERKLSLSSQESQESLPLSDQVWGEVDFSLRKKISVPN